jgi:hypothetical protein
MFHTAAESLAVENVARPRLKQQAERAIDDPSTDLRAAHQSETTNDLLDVIAGSEASSRVWRLPSPELSLPDQHTGLLRPEQSDTVMRFGLSYLEGDQVFRGIPPLLIAECPPAGVPLAPAGIKGRGEEWSRRVHVESLLRAARGSALPEPTPH